MNTYYGCQLKVLFHRAKISTNTGIVISLQFLQKTQLPFLRCEAIPLRQMLDFFAWPLVVYVWLSAPTMVNLYDSNLAQWRDLYL